jgi:hypothetical protein
VNKPLIKTKIEHVKMLLDSLIRDRTEKDKLLCTFCNIRADISLIKRELEVENV